MPGNAYCDKQVFSDAVMEMSSTLYRIAYSILRSDADCEDAVAEAIAKAFAAIAKLRDSALFKPWLVRILKNECYMITRKRKRLVPVEQLPEDIAMPSEGVDIDLQRALMQLPEEYRLALTLFYAEQYTVAEIAYILQVPEGTVKSRLSRGREQLRHKLTRGGDNY